MSSNIVKRILKARALAKNNPNENEAHLAAELALRLMREHAVSQADLDAAAQEREDPLIECRCYLTRTGRCMPAADYWNLPSEERRGLRAGKTAAWKRSLFVAVGNYLGLRTSFYSGTPCMNFYGFHSDVEAARKLWEVCVRQIDREAAAYLVETRERQRRDSEYVDRGAQRSEAVDFRESAVLGLQAKLNELTRVSEADHREAHALVLGRKQKVEAWVSTAYTFSKTSRSELASSFADGSRHNPAGWKVGQRLKLTADAEVESADARAIEGGP